MTQPFVKVCGITNLDSLQAAAEAGAEFVGFIFVPKSPRYLTLEQAKPLVEKARTLSLKVVTVFQDEDLDQVLTITEAIQPDFIQLHGDESVEYAQQLKFPLIKVIKVKDITPAVQTTFSRFAPLTEFFLLDRVQQGAGDPIASEVVTELSQGRPVILAGGLTPTNIASIATATQSAVVGYDVSSGVEEKPGVKSPALLKEFFRNLRSI